jgi:hypothetical protein
MEGAPLGVPHWAWGATGQPPPNPSWRALGQALGTGRDTNTHTQGCTGGTQRRMRGQRYVCMCVCVCDREHCTIGILSVTSKRTPPPLRPNITTHPTQHTHATDTGGCSRLWGRQTHHSEGGCRGGSNPARRGYGRGMRTTETIAGGAREDPTLHALVHKLHRRHGRGSGWVGEGEGGGHTGGHGVCAILSGAKGALHPQQPQADRRTMEGQKTR